MLTACLLTLCLFSNIYILTYIPTFLDIQTTCLRPLFCRLRFVALECCLLFFYFFVLSTTIFNFKIMGIQINKKSRNRGGWVGFGLIFYLLITFGLNLTKIS